MLIMFTKCFCEKKKMFNLCMPEINRCTLLGARCLFFLREPRASQNSGKTTRAKPY